jgi:hypothetical protein
MENTIIPPLSNLQIKKIKEAVKFHYGIDADDRDIDWIDKTLRNHYSIFHDQNIIRHLVTVNIDKILLKHRDEIGSLEFEEMMFDKLIFHYLTFASMCYRAGIPIGSIFLCRTAVETGLRERIAEEMAKEDIKSKEELPQKIWAQMKKLERKKLSELIKMAEEHKIVEGGEIEEIFRSQGLEKRVLDKFIHGNIDWIVRFIESKDRECTKVIGAKDILQEKKIIAEFPLIDQIAVSALKATTLIAEKLYFGKKDK